MRLLLTTPLIVGIFALLPWAGLAFDGRDDRQRSKVDFIGVFHPLT